MTPQQVIKNFMEMLDSHTFELSAYTKEASDAEGNALSTKILDRAVVACFNYSTMQELIDAFIADCTRYNEADSSNGWKTFLSEKCGIYLDNTDTGAITGSDANITVDGSTVGTGVEKSKENVVPEYANYYKAETQAAQFIDTGNNGWMIVATSGNDSILSGGEDSINAGAGSNFITLKGSRATVDAGEGFNSIFIDSDVKSVTILNYDADKVTLSGNTDVVTYGQTQTQTNNANNNSNAGDAVWIEDDTGDLPGTPLPAEPKRRTLEASSADSATNASDITLVGTDNYFNLDGTTNYSGSDTIHVDLSGAINPQNPVPAGGFIVSGSDTNASFVSTNSAAKQGQIVGQVASVYPNLMSFTFNGLTLNVCDRRLIDGNSTTVLKTFDSFEDVGVDSSDNDTNNAYEKYVVASIYKWWMKESLKLNYLSYDYSFEDEDATPITINLHFDKTVGGSSALAAVSHSYSYSGKAITLNLIVNKDYYQSLIDYNDVDGGAADAFVYLDRTIAHEFNHALMAAKDNYFAYLPKFIKEGMAEVTHGIDDKRTYSIMTLAKNIDSLSAVIKIDGNEYTAGDYSYAGGYMLLRYLAKQAAINTQNSFVPAQMPFVNVNLTDGNSTYYVGNTELNPTATTTPANYSVGAAQNYVYTPSDLFKQNISTNDSPWTLQISSSENTVIAGAGADFVNIMTGDSKGNFIDLGDGSNVANVLGSRNVVTGGSDTDSIQVQGQNHSVYGGAGDDTLLTTNTMGNAGNLFDAGAGADEITIGVSTNSTFLGGAGNDVISFLRFANLPTANAANYVDAGEGNDVITVMSTQQTIWGGAGDDTIKVSGQGHSIIGGTGNDLISQYSNSAGDNAYVFSGEFGNDTISWFMSNDKIHIAAGCATEMSAITSGNYVDSNNNVTGTYQNFTITVKKGNVVKGTINITMASGVTFDAATNIVADLEAEVNALDVTEDGQEVTLTDETDIIYVDAAQVSKFQLNGTIGSDDKIIFYSGTKENVLSNYTISGANVSGDNWSVDISGGFSSMEWSNLTATVTNYAATKDSDGALIRGTVAEQTFTLTGITQTDGITFDGNTITIPTANIDDSKTVTTTNYNLALAGDNVAEKIGGLELDGTTATYKSEGYSVGYYVDNNTISYNETATGGATLLELDGINDQFGTGDISDGAVNLNNNYLSGDKVTVINNDGGFTFNLDGDWSGKTFKGSSAGETISINAQNVTIDYEVGGGNDTIEGFSNGCKLLIGGDYTKTFSGQDVVLTVGTNTIIIKDAMKLDTLNINGVTVSTCPFEIDNDGNFMIQSDEDLITLSTYVTNGHNCNGKIFKLTANIDMRIVENFAPIGTNYEYSFKGTFDGNGKVISNLTISGNKKHQGLFGCNTGTIQNVTLSNVNISGTTQVGAVVGMNYGTVQNCSVTGTISGNSQIGGIVGGNQKAVTNNKVDAQVSGTGEDIGAIVGLSNGGNNVVSGNKYHSNQANAVGLNGDEGGTASDNTRLYALDLPEGVTAQGAIEFADKYYAAADATITIDGYTSGEISFDDGATLVNSDGTITVTIGDASFTIIGLNTSTAGKLWILDGTVAKYGDGYTAGGSLDGNKIVWRTAQVTTAQIELGGVNKLDGIEIKNRLIGNVTKQTVVLTAGNFSDGGISIQSGNNYAYEINGAGKFYGSGDKDTVSVTADNVTFNMGDGEDKIYIGSEVSRVYIEDFSLEDEIHFASTVQGLANVSGSLVADLGNSSVTIGAINEIAQEYGWENGSYYTGNSAGASIYGGSSKVVEYAPAVDKIKKLELDGITSNPSIDDRQVTLTADNFGDNVSVKSNDGNYKFVLSGDFSGKTFTGSAGNDDITNLTGKNNSINGGAGDDKKPA